jgi:hypothetical protein
MGGLEYDKEKLIVAGDYTHLFQNTPNSSSEKENLILICTQKFLAADFFPWIDQVLTHLPLHPDWRVIIKLHPRERPEDIARYLKYESENVHVEINGSLDEIFKKG